MDIGETHTQHTSHSLSKEPQRARQRDIQFEWIFDLFSTIDDAATYTAFLSLSTDLSLCVSWSFMKFPSEFMKSGKNL